MSAKKPGCKQVVKPLQRPVSDCNQLNRGVDPAIITHCDSNDKRDISLKSKPGKVLPLLSMVSSHAVNASNTALSLPSGNNPPLPGVVNSPINRDNSSQATKPGAMLSATDTIWLAEQVVVSFDQSAQKVSKVALKLEQDFNGLQNIVIWREELIKRLERRILETSEVLQRADDDLDQFVEVVGNDITAEELTNIVDNMRSIIQEEKEKMILYETYLKNFEKKDEFIEQIKHLTQEAARAQEDVNSTIMASQLALKCIRGASSNVKINIKDKEVTVLEILTETEKNSSTRLKTAIEQKEKMKTLRQRMLKIKEKITEIIENISKQITKANAVEKRITGIESQYLKYVTELNKY